MNRAHLSILLLALAAVAGCLAPSQVVQDGATSVPTTSSTGSETSTSFSSAPPPGPAVWLVHEEGNLTHTGHFLPSGACSRTVPGGGVDAEHKAVWNASWAHPPGATAIVLFVDPAISWAYPGICGGDQLFAVAAPGGNRTQRDGTADLHFRVGPGGATLNGQALRDGLTLDAAVDTSWTDDAGPHRVTGTVRYTVSAGYHLLPRADPRGPPALDLYWGPPLA